MSIFQKHFVFIGLFFICLQISAQNDNYEKAYDAYESGDVELAIELFKPIESSNPFGNNCIATEIFKRHSCLPTFR